YLSLQMPGALMAERWGARRLIGSIMIAWGGLSVLTGLVQAPLHRYAARFLLGAAEAAFFPAVLIYLSHWFVYEDRATAIANFMAAIPVSFIIGAPVAGVLLGVHWVRSRRLALAILPGRRTGCAPRGERDPLPFRRTGQHRMAERGGAFLARPNIGEREAD